jgi:hypothetical protein
MKTRPQPVGFLGRWMLDEHRTIGVLARGRWPRLPLDPRDVPGPRRDPVRKPGRLWYRGRRPEVPAAPVHAVLTGEA